jgi:DeoR family transcriptional regulator, fructose operon transcriptional repressor
MKNSLAQPPVTFAQKAALNADAKDRICRRAAAEIQDGDVLFMDCGSTVFRLCAFIKNKRIKVITNSLPVAHALLGSEVSVNLIGGEVDAERQAVHGSMAQEHVARYHATRAFLGVDGLSVANGLSAHSEHEASMTLAMAARATTTYLLCDSSKLGRESYLPFAPLGLVGCLITDALAEQIREFEKAGLRVVQA